MKPGFLKFVSATGLLVSSLASASTTVEHDGRYIYYKSAYAHLNKFEQDTLVKDSVALLQNELAQNIGKVEGLHTLSNYMMTPKALDEMTKEAQQAVDVADQYNIQSLLPTALMFYGGGSVTFGLLANGKVSGDLGIVIVPSKVTQIDTFTNQSKTYFQLQWGFVVVPHLYAGVGVGAGGTSSLGAALIFGQLNSVDEFKGLLISGSAQAMAVAGADVEAAMVHNIGAHKTFLMVKAEVDWGAEASAGLDGSGGYIQPLDSFLDQASGLKAVLAPAGTAPVEAIATNAVPAPTPSPSGH